MKHVFLRSVLFFLLAGSPLFAQTSLQLILPEGPDWNRLDEGKSVAFRLGVQGGPPADSVRFALAEGRLDGMELDSLGRFQWTPGFDLVNRVQGSRTFPVIFEAWNAANPGQRTRKTAEFRVQHTNRPPVAGELKPFYVKYNALNTYQVDPNVVNDPDQDPLLFVPIADQMPEGAKLSAQGEFSWKPSQAQYNKLKAGPMFIEFFVEDQPAKTRTKGRLKVEATQMDLPPEISVVPNVTSIKAKEDATINLVFYLTDPNGDADIESFGLLSDNPDVPRNALKRNASTQYEFTWKPGYTFVRDPLDSLSFNVTFFVLDKTQKRDEKTVRFTILNAVNEREKDFQLYTQYRTGLIRAWELIGQLSEKQETLRQTYERAKRGKKKRSVVNASLGAVSALAPVTIYQNNPNTSRAISAVGGTAVATVGTLEATEVIGKSIKDLVDQLNSVIAKKNELQTKGDIFARKYNLKASRRNEAQFTRDLDEFSATMSLNGLLALELDAGWVEKNTPTDRKIKKTFKDFEPFEE
jgi:hypothetical protein